MLKVKADAAPVAATPPSEPTLTDVLSTAITIARGAGAILREGISTIESRRTTPLRFKSSAIDPVTEYDVRSEQFIVTTLRQAFPSHHIFGEEGGSYQTEENSQHRAQSTELGTQNYTWHIDPLDGTVNFSHGFPIFCVSMGLLIDGVPAVGVVYSPVSDEMYAAARGHGATRNGVPVHVSDTPDLKSSLLVTGFPYDSHTNDTNVPEFVGFQRTSQAARRIGSAALDLCPVACGQMDGYWEQKIKPHDIAAGIVLVREAGGVVTDFTGGDGMIASGLIVASNGLIQHEMLDVLKRARSH